MAGVTQGLLAALEVVSGLYDIVFCTSQKEMSPSSVVMSIAGLLKVDVSGISGWHPDACELQELKGGERYADLGVPAPRVPPSVCAKLQILEPRSWLAQAFLPSSVSAPSAV